MWKNVPMKLPARPSVSWRDIFCSPSQSYINEETKVKQETRGLPTAFNDVELGHVGWRVTLLERWKSLDASRRAIDDANQPSRYEGGFNFKIKAVASGQDDWTDLVDGWNARQPIDPSVVRKK